MDYSSRLAELLYRLKHIYGAGFDRGTLLIGEFTPTWVRALFAERTCLGGKAEGLVISHEK